MKPRFLILLALAIGLAAYLANAAKNKPTTVAEIDDQPSFISNSGETFEEMQAGKDPLWKRPLPGSEPSQKPEFDIRVEVDSSGKKNRLYLFVSEKHGFYVESLTMRVWYKGPGVTGPGDSPIKATTVKEIYIKANETLRTCMEIVPAELIRVNGQIGTSANWDAEMIKYGRARDKNPDPLPHIIADDRELCGG